NAVARRSECGAAFVARAFVERQGRRSLRRLSRHHIESAARRARSYRHALSSRASHRKLAVLLARGERRNRQQFRGPVGGLPDGGGNASLGTCPTRSFGWRQRGARSRGAHVVTAAG